MKTLAAFFFFTFFCLLTNAQDASKLSYEPRHYQEIKKEFSNAFLLNLGRATEEETSKRFCFAASNVYEWAAELNAANAKICMSLCGLDISDRSSFLFDSSKLFYNPESRNTALDFESHLAWEVRLSVSLEF